MLLASSLLTTGKNQNVCLATASPALRILAFYSSHQKLFSRPEMFIYGFNNRTGP